MKAIILAAGKGSRLGNITKENPKGMIKIFGKSLIERQIQIYRDYGIKEIIVITGHKSENINFDNVIYIKNQNFEITNMNESFFCAAEKLTDSIIVSYADIIFDQKIIQEMIETFADIAVAVNLNWEKSYEGRKFHPLSEAENILMNENGKIIQIKKNISKKLHNQKIGEFLGIMKLSKKGAQNILKKYLELKGKHKGNFHSSNSLEQCYITDMLQEMIDSNHNVMPIITKNEWYEIDTKEDLEKLEKSSKFN